MIITLVYKVAKVRIAREKAAKSFVCDDLSDDTWTMKVTMVSIPLVILFEW